MKTIRTGLTYDDVLLIPQKTPLVSRSEVNLSTRLTRNISVGVPIVPANMDSVTEHEMAIAIAEIGGIGLIHRFNTIQEEVDEVRKVKDKGYKVGASVGVKGDFLERAEALADAGADVLVIDIAHGHSVQLLKAIEMLKKRVKNVDIIAGNIATVHGAKDLLDAGADALKVGIGPGAFCTTRVVTGAGVPQLTAVLEVAEIAKEYDVPVIADGGIRYSGDMVKALAAGASTVMLGSKFAGCDEAPGEVIEYEGGMFKLARGMASSAANAARVEKDKNVKLDVDSYTPEGVEGYVPYTGSVKPMIEKWLGGIRSGFSYCGARNMEELWEKSEFIQITTSALIESHPHDIQVKK